MWYPIWKWLLCEGVILLGMGITCSIWYNCCLLLMWLSQYNLRMRFFILIVCCFLVCKVCCSLDVLSKIPKRFRMRQAMAICRQSGCTYESEFWDGFLLEFFIEGINVWPTQGVGVYLGTVFLVFFYW